MFNKQLVFGDTWRMNQKQIMPPCPSCTGPVLKLGDIQMDGTTSE